MQAYCDQHGAWLAPHGKTTMAPRMWADQLRAGAWAITVANLAQLQVARGFGFERIIVANEMITPYDARYLAGQLAEHPDAEIYVLVDNLDAVERLVSGLRADGASRPLAVFAEMGMAGGRCGIRTVDGLIELARAVLEAEPTLRLAGVEGYEGIAGGATDDEQLAAVDAFLDQIADSVRAIEAMAPDHGPLLVSAGGSSYFDRVVARLGRDVLPEAQLVLRSGVYITHDEGAYDRSSPFGGQSVRPLGNDHLIPALEVWSAVVSRPEPNLAILGMGKRDVPHDLGLPFPRLHVNRSGDLKSLDEGYEIFRINDQHVYLRLPENAAMSVGDLVGCGISHPCTAFDKWRTIYVVDETRTIIDAVRTFF
jgi:D-serine dehydratase